MSVQDTAPELTVAHLIELFEYGDLYDEATEVLPAILSAAHDYFDDRSRFDVSDVLGIARRVLSAESEEKPEAHIAGLINDIGHLALFLTGRDVSPTTRQRLDAIVAASGINDEPAASPTVQGEEVRP
jgi:hypothetical protein